MTEQTTIFPDPQPVDHAAMLPHVHCRGCDARMVWVSSQAGKAVPLDPLPVPNGNLVFVEGAEPPTVRYLRKGDVAPAGTRRYQSHFATCVRADQFRRRPSCAEPA